MDAEGRERKTSSANRVCGSLTDKQTSGLLPLGPSEADHHRQVEDGRNYKWVVAVSREIGLQDIRTYVKDPRGYFR